MSVKVAPSEPTGGMYFVLRQDLDQIQSLRVNSTHKCVYPFCKDRILSIVYGGSKSAHACQFFAGSLESANSSILAAQGFFKEVVGKKIRILC